MFSKSALTVLERRYLKKGPNGVPAEKPEDMFRRVAKVVAAADRQWDRSAADVEQTTERFFSLMMEQRFMPNSPTLMNAGRDLGQLSACFVLPVGDSMEEIFDAVKHAALIHKSGGGTGFAFSRLRPAKSTVCTTGGVASGPVSFMRVFNAATEAVKQGGTRRGANMGMLRVDHPDILEFISCKSDVSELTNFNISVALTDTFMQAVTDDAGYDLIDPCTKKKTGELDARAVFETIVERAWATGEPVIVFLDRVNALHPVPSLGEIEATNPCGEQPLLPYESCNLGSINIAAFVREDPLPRFDVDAFRRTVADAVHFLDNVITVNNYPLPEIREQTLKSRKVGLGVMGLADLLYQLRIPYGSEESLRIARKVQIGCGNLYITVNYDEAGICEVFTSLGRAGGCPSQSEATSRLLSVALRAGVQPQDLIEQLRGVRCYSSKNKKNAGALSCPDAIGRVLETVLEMRDGKTESLMQAEPQKKTSEDDADAGGQAGSDAVCPECGATLEHEGGCNVCRSCGYSKCG